MDINTIYVGIKGIGMSALVLILNDEDCKVAGSDIKSILLRKGDQNKWGSRSIHLMKKC